MVVRPRRSVEVEEDAPCRQLVRLAPNLGLIEERTFEIKLTERDGCDDEVGGVQRIEDDVVIGRGRIDEDEVVRKTGGLEG